MAAACEANTQSMFGADTWRGTWEDPEHRNTAKKINEHRITARKVDGTPSPQQLSVAT